MAGWPAPTRQIAPSSPSKVASSRLIDAAVGSPVHVAAAAFAGGDRSTAVASLALFVAAMEDEPGAAFLACFCISQRLRQMLLAVAA